MRRIAAVMMALALVAGCTSLDKEIAKDRAANQAAAQQTCKDHNQQLYDFYPQNGTEKVLCTQASPYKLFAYIQKRK